jgi:hypothetical protein
MKRTNRKAWLSGFYPKTAFTVGLMLIAQVSQAADFNMAGNMRVIADFLMTLAPFLGFLIFASGIYQFYKHEKTRDERYGTASSIAKIIIGAFLVSINWFYGFMASSFVGGDASSSGSGSRLLLAVDAQMAEGSKLAVNSVIPAETVTGLFAFIAVIGIIAFINGLLALKNLGDGRHDERDLYKGITRIAGGLVCLNLKWAACFMGQLFGIAMLCPT